MTAPHSRTWSRNKEQGHSRWLDNWRLLHQCGGACSECQREVTQLCLGRSASSRDHCRLQSKVKVTGPVLRPPRPPVHPVSGILARACNKVLRTDLQDARRGNARACAQARQLLGRSQRAREQELGECTCSIAIFASMAAAFSCGCPCAPAAPCTQQRLTCTAAAPAQFGRYFEIEERNTTFLQECRAGAVLFLTVCYIIRRFCSRAARTCCGRSRPAVPTHQSCTGLLTSCNTISQQSPVA